MPSSWPSPFSCFAHQGSIARPSYGAPIRLTQKPRWARSTALSCHDVRRSSTNGTSVPEPNTSSVAGSYFPPRLKGKTCMITGGASGIGFAVAQRFLREGAGKVVLVGRRKERLLDAVEQLRREQGNPVQLQEQIDEMATESSAVQEMGNEIESKPEPVGSRTAVPSSAEAQDPSRRESQSHEEPGSGQFGLLVGDVGDPSFWSDGVRKEMDNVDILINAAGVSYSALLPLAKDEHIAQILTTNLQGTIFACRAMTRRALRRQRKPASSEQGNSGRLTKCIINVSSLHATKGGVGAATYASTKAGVIALTRAIAAEGSLSASGAVVRANVIVPGYIDTKMLDDFSDAFRTEAQQSIPLKRFGTCAEVADAAVFLATNQYANNCVLNLDGGLSAM